MGLDLVELTIRLEDAFGVDIPDRVASDLTTPREVTDYLLSQLQLGEQTGCIWQQAFYRLRQEFVPVLGIQRSDFRPASKLAQLLPIRDRRRIWNDLRSQLGATALPELARPGWLFFLLSLITILTALTVFLYTGIVTKSSNLAILMSVLAASVVGYGVATLSRPLKRQFRYGHEHAGDLARYLAAHSPHTFKQEWTREEVAQLVREIIIYETGVTEFTEDSRFVQDMHLD